ncbi:MAG: CapA family protein [Deltaproteobacteria bacterium]|nr:CapA family protein [Deltaproteobacteria bacterium]
MDGREKNTVVIHLVGDNGPRRIEHGENPEDLYKACAPKLREADILFGQLERNFSLRGSVQYHSPNQYVTRVHPDNIRALTFAGFTIMSLASNKIMGWGPDPLVDTIDLLKKNGITPVGAGRDIAEARKPVFIDRKDTRIGFLAYCCVVPPGYEALDDRPGINPIHVSTYYEPASRMPGTVSPGDPPKVVTIADQEDMERMQQEIKDVKSKADVVIVSQHWGIPYLPGMLAMYQPVVGHAAIDAGADLIVGHHAHVPKGIEVYKGKTIFYSVGDFSEEGSSGLGKIPQQGGFSMTGRHLARMEPYGVEWLHDPEWNRFQGPIYRRYVLVAKCVITDKKIRKVGFLPMYVNPLIEPQPLNKEDPRFEEVVGYMRPLAKKLGTELTVTGDEVVVYEE